MKAHYLVGVALLLALAACRPGAAEYTESEAPKNLIVDNASTRVDLRFVPGSSRLAARDAWRLRALAANGSIAPSDRVMVATGGSPALAAARFDAIASQLLHYRIVPSKVTLAGIPANHALLQVGRYLVTMPPCPDWSKEATVRFTNTAGSNFGCSTAVDLGMSVASPADLVEGRPVGLAEAEPAANAVDRYMTDKVQLPGAVALGPISMTGAGAPAGGGGGGGGATP